MSVVLSDWQLLEGRCVWPRNPHASGGTITSEIRHLRFSEDYEGSCGLLSSQAASRLRRTLTEGWVTLSCPEIKRKDGVRPLDTPATGSGASLMWRNLCPCQHGAAGCKSPWYDPGECEEMR